MGLVMTKVGELVEVKVDGNSPNLYHRSNFQFNAIGTTKVKVLITGKNTYTGQFLFTQITIGGSACTDYSDFKTKLGGIMA